MENDLDSYMEWKLPVPFQRVSFWSRVTVEREEYAYSLFSLVAEVGAYMGLLLGISTYSMKDTVR